MDHQIRQDINATINEIRDAGTYKAERVISTPQGASIQVADQPPVRNMCANNYLGLAQHPDFIQATHEADNNCGYVQSSRRFTAGTQASHPAP